MKAFSGGQLLDARTSPFGQALTKYQCIQYALDKPGVLTVLPGVRNRADLQRILGFLHASPEERDYSILGTFAPQDASGICVYCNHCQPCSAGLDVGIINKYYDLARAGDELARGHYDKLEKKAGDCIGCGHCDRRCPFHVAAGRPDGGNPGLFSARNQLPRRHCQPAIPRTGNALRKAKNAFRRAFLSVSALLPISPHSRQTAYFQDSFSNCPPHVVLFPAVL